MPTRTTSIGARTAVVCAIISAGGGAARGQRQVPAIGQLDHAVWAARDGAPSSVSALAQTADGMLWIGTTTGLYDFDGVRFESFEPPAGVALPSLSVSALLATPNDSLWIGYTRGGTTVLTRGRATSYSARDGVPVGTVTAIAFDSAGSIWAATTSGLARFRDDRWQRMGPDHGYPDSGMTSDLLVDRRGTLWAATSSGVLALTRGSSRFVRQAASLDPTGSGAGVLREAPDGSVWGASLTLGLTRLSDSSGAPIPMRAEADHEREAWGLLVDRHANAWVMERRGLVRVSLGRRSSGARQSLPVTPVPLANRVRPSALLEDREGNVWVGTTGGLDRFRETKFNPVMLPPAVRLPSVAAADQGSVWVGSEPALFAVGDSVDVHKGTLGVTCAYRDLRGGIWLGAAGALWYASPGTASSRTRFSRIGLPPGAANGVVQAIALSTEGDLWVSIWSDVTRAVFRRRGGVWSRFSGPSDVANQLALVITTDSAGRTWLGYSDNRLMLVAPASTRIFSEPDGLHLGTVTAIFVRGNHVWIGGESGVEALDGERLRSLDVDVKLRGITGIVETPNGDLWLNGAGGVTRIELGEVRSALHESGYRARAERFDYRDGLNGEPPQVRPLPTAIEGTDGRLWFSTETVAWIDPANIKRNTLRPQVHVRTLMADGRRYDLALRVALPAGTGDVQIAYTAPSLTMPDRVQFRYKLVGLDTDWQSPGSRREAYYTNLKPGSYHFQVIAANEDGMWNESGASLEFTIPPTFAQSRWFAAMWAAVIAAMVWFVYQMRMRQLAAQLRARYHAALTERTRIAQELHDTLLQGFTGITIQLRAIQRILVRRPEEGAVALEAALTAADTALRDARSTIWDMKAVELEGNNLPEALEGAMRSVTTGASVELSFTLRGDPRPLSPELEVAALRIGREAVLNAVKHADARTVDVTLEYETDFLRLNVRDDGRGMQVGVAEAAAADGHLGIVGMRTRAHRAEGTMDIASEPGRGTTVRASLPITGQKSSK